MDTASFPVSGVRLQVFLSRCDVCSRRKALALIFEGRVKVNDQVIVEPSHLVNPNNDKVFVDGKNIETKAPVYILLNKPRGYVTTKSDVHAEKTVLDLLPPRLRYLHPVGRLDKETEGLLLLTNDGMLTYLLTHPKFNIDKTYYAEVTGKLSEKDKAHLERGVYLEGKVTAPARITRIQHAGNLTTFYMTIHEGRKRQIRNMLAVLGYRVVRLKRLAQGPLTLGTLVSGAWRLLRAPEVNILKTYLNRNSANL